MEKSIETIWKEGFLKSDALVAPKINRLYETKSIGIVAKYKRMIGINIFAVAVFALIVFAASFWFQVLLSGIIISVLLATLVGISIPLYQELDQLEPSVNSLNYLKEFKKWLDKTYAIMRRYYRFAYPILFLAFVPAMTMFEVSTIPDFVSIYKRLILTHDFIWNGIPLIFWLVTLTIATIGGLLSNKLYQLDYNSVYGPITKRMNELIAEMEQLNH